MSIGEIPTSLPAVEGAIQYRRAQLAHHLLSRLGTNVRHGPFMGLDLGKDVLDHPMPVARLLGFEYPAWLPSIRHLCRRNTHLVSLGAADEHLARGFLHAGLVSRAWQLGGRHVVADSMAGLTRCEPGFNLSNLLEVLQQGTRSCSEPPPHLLLIVETSRALLDWLNGSDLASLVASYKVSITCLWPTDLDAEVRSQLPLALSTSPVRLTAKADLPTPAELKTLPPTELALLKSNSGPTEWFTCDLGQLAARRRTLVCTHAGDQFVAKLLRSMQEDSFEPLSIDILHYTNPGVSGPRATAAGRAGIYPKGVGVYETETLATPMDDLRRFTSELRITQEHSAMDEPALAFFDNYEQFFVWSISTANADLLRWLTSMYGRERVELLVSDDEVDRRWKVKQLLKTNPEATEIAATYLPAPVEHAFECVRHFWVPRLPWESMIRLERRSDCVIHACTLPIKNDLSTLTTVAPPNDCYVLMLHPKPSLPKDEVLAQLQRFLQNWQVDRKLRIVTIRNDIASSELQFPDGRGVCELQVYPYPLGESMYFELMARCHGLMLVPRGGFTSTRDAIRMGLDIHEDGSLFSPNRITLAEEMGINVLKPQPIQALHHGWVQDPVQRKHQQRCIADWDRAAIAHLRGALL